MSTIPNPTPRTDEDWQIAYASACSILGSADLYGPQPGDCYVAKGLPVNTSLVVIRNFLERAWKDWDFTDLPEVVACLDRVLDDLSL